MGQIIKQRRSYVEKQKSENTVADDGTYYYYNVNDVVPNPSIYTNRRFRSPKTLQSDWYNELMEDKPYVNYTYELLHDWYDQFKDDYIKHIFRGQQLPIDWKSKIGNSDSSYNLKTLHTVPIRKGDIVLRDDGDIFMLNWAIQAHANNLTTQAARCNFIITVKRERPERVDSEGFLIADSSFDTIVDQLPCIVTEYQGRPDFQEYVNVPGITPDNLLSLSLQWNDKTREIELGDTFAYGKFNYRVVNYVMTEINKEMTSGILILNAKREAGGHL